MEKKIIEIIAAMSLLDEGEITEKELLIDIGIDSLKMVEIIMNLEDTFQIRFDDAELDPTNLTTVKSVINLTEKYIHK